MSGWGAQIFGLNVTPKAYASGSAGWGSKPYDLPTGLAYGDEHKFGMEYGAGLDLTTDSGVFGFGGHGHAYSGGLQHPEALRQFLEPGKEMSEAWGGAGLNKIGATYSSPPTGYFPKGQHSLGFDVTNNPDTSGFFEDPQYMGRATLRW